MNKCKMLELNDLSTLTLDDLQDEYKELWLRYQQLLKKNENDAQQIHELKRNLDTALAGEAYLSQELEQLTAAPDEKLKEAVSACNKTLAELKELKCKYDALELDHTTMVEKCESLVAENEQLHIKINMNDCEKNRRRHSLALEERIDAVDRENMELLQEINESKVRYTMTIAEREKNIELLQDQLYCLNENMQIKRNEIDEKTQELECAQELLIEANAKIALLTATALPENNGSKGNSLFAEVDDQRQAMKQLLAAQKKNYLEMKKMHNESSEEIRQLKRENIAMHTELQACSAIFCNADKTYHDKLKERIRQLVEQNEELERNLSWTQQKLNEMASNKGVLCFDTMLNFCKQQTCELKKQLHSERIKKGSVEEQLRTSEQTMARWRFESLKSRCILLDRENLLNEHKISYKPNKAVKFVISQSELEKAQPIILNEQLMKDVLAKKELQTTVQVVDEESKQIYEDKIVDDKKLDNDKREEKVVEPLTAVQSKNVIDIDENKENVELECSGTRITKTTPSSLKGFGTVGPSILCKDRDIFGKAMNKNVQFSAEAATVHNLSPVVMSETSNKVTKQVRSKSNIVVHRVFFNSNFNKQENKN